jgi:hypothetical protein
MRLTKEKLKTISLEDLAVIIRSRRRGLSKAQRRDMKKIKIN